MGVFLAPPSGFVKFPDQDPFETLVGPFHYKESGGHTACGFLTDARHDNGRQTVQGGVLTAFGHFAVNQIARARLGARGTILSFKGDFLRAVQVDDVVIARADLMAEGTGHLTVQGTMRVDEVPVVAFTGIVAKSPPPSVTGRGRELPTPVPKGFRQRRPGRGGPVQAHTGPFYFRKTPEIITGGMRAERRHCNTDGTVHDGMLMIFADAMLGIVGPAPMDTMAVTVSLAMEYAPGVHAFDGDFIEAHGEVVSADRALGFSRTHLAADGRIIATASAVLRRAGPLPGRDGKAGL